MSYNDLHYSEWLADQTKLAQTWFTCQVCEQNLSVTEKARNGYTDCCKLCAEEIEKDLQELGFSA